MKYLYNENCKTHVKEIKEEHTQTQKYRNLHIHVSEEPTLLIYHMPKAALIQLASNC